MAALLLLWLVMVMFGGSDAAWCVCKPELSDTALQKTLDYACGAGADCNPIHQNGPCFNPNTVKAHCSYATNSFYQRKGQAQGTCDFAGTATLTSSDPSAADCIYPASTGAAGTSSSTASNLNPTTGTGGVLGGLGPSGSSLDTNDGGFISRAGIISLILSVLFSGFLFWMA